MCGITGFWGDRTPQPEVVLGRMTRALQRRGPDNEGLWHDKVHSVFLGHRRLAIQDLTETGHQPMASHSGRYQITYNGEIYNNSELRVQLRKHASNINWRGSSDTETLLTAIDAWGVRGALEHVDGMFAFALWDREKKSLVLARDRCGEKPLYYGMAGGNLLFGSELSSIAVHPSANFEIDRNAIADYLKYSSVPAPFTIYRGFFKLRPGHLVEIGNFANVSEDQEVYWDVEQVALQGAAFQNDCSASEWSDLIREEIEKIVCSRMLSDVPLGSFLSGGIDSSLVTAIMQKHNQSPIKTFSIGFKEQSHDEAPFARAVANHLGTSHTEFYVDSKDALDVVPELGQLWNEPFADSSQIPTYLVSKLTSSAVTVALSGDGGDELFGGYRRYKEASRIWGTLEKYPASLRKIVAFVGECTASVVNRSCYAIPTLSSSSIARRSLKLAHIAPLLAHSTQDEMYQYMMTHCKNPEIIVPGSTPRELYSPSNETQELSFLQRMMLYDFQMYLPNTILTKVDRASMAVGLEARAPLLSQRLVELAWKTPDNMKIRRSKGKWIMHDVLGHYLPSELIDRPKMGFAVPIESWLRGPLRDWGESLLDPTLLRDQGFLDPVPIRKMWAEHQNRQFNWHYYLWDVLMFQNWLEKFHSQTAMAVNNNH